MRYRVGDIRATGLEAKWGRTCQGRPAIFVRLPQNHKHRTSNIWWLLTNHMWEQMQSGKNAVEVLDNHTLLGDIFSVPA